MSQEDKKWITTVARTTIMCCRRDQDCIWTVEIVEIIHMDQNEEKNINGCIIAQQYNLHKIYCISSEEKNVNGCILYMVA